MPFEKNDLRINRNGRRPGSPNRTTAKTKDWVLNFIEKYQKQFESDFQNLEPEKRVSIFEKLLSFVIPKQSQVDISQEYRQLEMLLIKAPEKAIEAISLKIIELHNKNTENEND